MDGTEQIAIPLKTCTSSCGTSGEHRTGRVPLPIGNGGVGIRGASQKRRGRQLMEGEEDFINFKYFMHMFIFYGSFLVLDILCL